MIIRRIEVEELFDYYCYEINLNVDSPISIIHAPNGYGKTTVFKMINYVLEFDMAAMGEIPFKKFGVEFEDGTRIITEKRRENVGENRRYSEENIVFLLISEKKKLDFTMPVSGPVFMRIKEEGLEGYFRRVELRRRHRDIPENDEASNICKKIERIKECLSELENGAVVNFIESNRLYSNDFKSNRDRVFFRDEFEGKDYRSFFVDDEKMSARNYTNENIVRDARDIALKIQDARQRYSLESEKRDRDFPDRLVKKVESNEGYFNDNEIASQLEELEKKRMELENAGLVLSGKKTLRPSNEIDNTMRKFYTLYIQDTFENLVCMTK